MCRNAYPLGRVAEFAGVLDEQVSLANMDAYRATHRRDVSPVVHDEPNVTRIQKRSKIASLRVDSPRRGALVSELHQSNAGGCQRFGQSPQRRRGKIGIEDCVNGWE